VKKCKRKSKKQTEMLVHMNWMTLVANRGLLLEAVEVDGSSLRDSKSSLSSSKSARPKGINCPINRNYDREAYPLEVSSHISPLYRTCP
jgi:hypothetical protein